MFEMPNNVRDAGERAAPVTGGRRAARRAQTRDEIVAAAWEVARERGLAGLTMRDLGERVGMKAPSLYSYFASKHDIYDAMFLEGNRAFVAALESVDRRGSARSRARRAMKAFLMFCTADPVRFQLLFQRTIPDFAPSRESYAVAQEAYDAVVRELAEIGITGSGVVDLWTALAVGLASQQLANDPGGRRWTQLSDRAVDMLLAAIEPAPGTKGRTR